MTTDPGILSRIRKLLNKAEHAATDPAEAEVYNAKAAELIAVYGIERARITLDEPTADRVVQRTFTFRRPYERDKASLLAAIAYPLRVEPVYAPARRGEGKKLHLFGCESDLDRVGMLYDSLVIQAMRGLPNSVPSQLGRSAPSLAAHRRSWLNGFAQAVTTRLREAEEAARREHTDDGGGTLALALVDREHRARNLRDETFPHLRPTMRSVGRSGTASGYAAGSRADLGGSRLNGSGKALRS